MPKAWIGVLLLLSVTFIVTDRLFNFIDDEVTILNDAAAPPRATLAKYVSGTGQHEHPPLNDLILHFWLVVTRGHMRLLRVPSIAFYIVGLGIMAAAAIRLGTVHESAIPASSPLAGRAALWIGALWPFGFHFGRVAAWYSLSFALVSLLTFLYLDFVITPTWPELAKILAVAAALLYTSYYAWALLACLSTDFVLRHRQDWKGCIRWLIPSAAALALIYLPMWKAFFAEISGVVGPPELGKRLLLVLGFCFYSLFVSESLAPWYWWAGIPLGLAALGSSVMIFILSKGPARRFFIYFLVAFTGMAVLGILETKRLLLIAPWFLIPLACSVAQPRCRLSRVLAFLLAGTFLAGWLGIGLRNYYAAPRWVEPWQTVALNAADAWRKGATVVANSPSFFLYLTYDLNLTALGHQKFVGFLPESVRGKNIYSTDDWLASESPISERVLLVRGVEFSAPGITEQAQAKLVARCGEPSLTRFYQDPGYVLKRKLFPALQQPEWRVEIRNYSCGIPAHD